MEQPMDYEGPHLEIIVRDPKQDNTQQVIEKVLDNVSERAGVCLFQKDKIDGPLT
jgi:hypothetical protein